MRKTLLASLVSLPLLLTGCATTGGPLSPDQINQLVAQIRQYTAAACAFQPTISGVTALIAAFYAPAAPVVGLVNVIGDAICKAPQTRAALRRGVVQATRIVQTPKGPVAVTGVNYPK